MYYPEALYRTLDFLPAIAALVTALITVYAAFRSGTVRRLRVGNLLELEGADRATVNRIRAEVAAARGGDAIPFEIEQLANYYALSLGQARISFWFSLVFASIGFMVIIGAAFLYREGDYGSASVKILSGIIIDAVAALFFVQSRRAQESMSAFFEKLRSDRQFAEARKMCEEINDDAIKDTLKTILVLHYSGLESGPMMNVLAGVQKTGRGQDDAQPGPVAR